MHALEASSRFKSGLYSPNIGFNLKLSWLPMLSSSRFCGSPWGMFSHEWGTDEVLVHLQMDLLLLQRARKCRNSRCCGCPRQCRYSRCCGCCRECAGSSGEEKKWGGAEQIAEPLRAGARRWLQEKKVLHHPLSTSSNKGHQCLLARWAACTDCSMRCFSHKSPTELLVERVGTCAENKDRFWGNCCSKSSPKDIPRKIFSVIASPSNSCSSLLVGHSEVPASSAIVTASEEVPQVQDLEVDLSKIDLAKLVWGLGVSNLNTHKMCQVWLGLAKTCVEVFNVWHLVPLAAGGAAQLH